MHRQSSAIREIVESHGARGYLDIQAQLLEGDIKMPNGRTLKQRKPEDFSIKTLFEGLVGPVEENLAYGRDQVGFVEMPANLSEAVTSGAFPSAVGQLIAAKVIEGYEDDAGFIGDQLVETVKSKMRGERMVGFTTLQGPKEVIEGEAYEDSHFGDKFVGSRETKRGRLLSISEEAVYFDQTGQILSRAQGLGYMARQERERRIIRAVIDADSGQEVYKPNGVAEQLYSAGNNNLLTTNTPLVDWTDIQEVLVFHATNVTDDRVADDANSPQPIVWMPRQLLTATELAGVAARLISATQVVDGGSGPRMTTGNPLSGLVPGLTALSSVFIDNATDGDQWDDASDWFLGDFPRQFKYKEIWPIQTFRAPLQNDEMFERDTLARFKVREFGDVVAVEERFVIKVNAG